MDDDYATILVFACARSDFTAEEKPIGRAETKAQAARLLRKFLSERDGDDYELSAADIYYSRPLSAYFTEE